jgi:divalent metal cation (Fe/Co/Zn/Cd) transporter
MVTIAKSDARLQVRGIRLEQFTIFYNVFEGVIAITAGLIASYVSLIGFGVDSGIEVFAAVLVLTRLRAQFYGGEFDETKERRALKLIGLTFFMLAIFVSVSSLRNLFFGSTPEVSEVGIALTLLSVLVMPFLASLKMKTGKQIGSILLIADAKETRLCAWLSVSTLAGLISFYLFGWAWLDSVASLVIAGFAIMEGREAWSGELVCEDCECVGTCHC